MSGYESRLQLTLIRPRGKDREQTTANHSNLPYLYDDSAPPDCPARPYREQREQGACSVLCHAVSQKKCGATTIYVGSTIFRGTPKVFCLHTQGDRACRGLGGVETESRKARGRTFTRRVETRNKAFRGPQEQLLCGLDLAQTPSSAGDAGRSSGAQPARAAEPSQGCVPGRSVGASMGPMAHEAVLLCWVSRAPLPLETPSSVADKNRCVPRVYIPDLLLYTAQTGSLRSAAPSHGTVYTAVPPRTITQARKQRASAAHKTLIMPEPRRS